MIMDSPRLDRNLLLAKAWAAFIVGDVQELIQYFVFTVKSDKRRSETDRNYFAFDLTEIHVNKER